MVEKEYVVATVSNNVHGNFIANSKFCSSHRTMSLALDKFAELEKEMNEKFMGREDYGNGAIMSEFIIIHDGYQVL